MHRKSCFAFTLALIAITPAFSGNAHSQELDLATFCKCSEFRQSASALFGAAFEAQEIRLSSPFAWRIHPIFKIPEFHKGIDIVAAQGTPVHLLTAGVVEEAARKGTYGLFVKIRHSIDFETAFAHLDALADGIRPGVMVFAGDEIGKVGSTGMSTGPHLHLETILRGEPVNPVCTSQHTVKPIPPSIQPKAKAPLRARAAHKSGKRKQP